MLDLFGAPQPDRTDGKSIVGLGPDFTPAPDDLSTVIEQIIERNGYPDIVTDISLGARTIFASVPYFLARSSTASSAPWSPLRPKTSS